MDIEEFINEAHPWALTPCLYIVKQMFRGNTAYRCGMAGGSLYADADRPYNSSSTLSGLIGRLNMYKNMWLPMKGKIFAALRIPPARQTPLLIVQLWLGWCSSCSRMP